MDMLELTPHDTQFLYIAYWILTLLALLSKLGKSENVTSSLDRAKASKVPSSTSHILTR